jgi:hypothetical protein
VNRRPESIDGAIVGAANFTSPYVALSSNAAGKGGGLKAMDNHRQKRQSKAERAPSSPRAYAQPAKHALAEALAEIHLIKRPFSHYPHHARVETNNQKDKTGINRTAMNQHCTDHAS